MSSEGRNGTWDLDGCLEVICISLSIWEYFEEHIWIRHDMEECRWGHWSSLTSSHLIASLVYHWWKTPCSIALGRVVIDIDDTQVD